VCVCLRERESAKCEERGRCEEKLWQSDYMECQRRLSLAPLPLYRVRSLDEQTLHKVTLLQKCVRRAKQRKRSARTVEFVTWCVSFWSCELVRDAKCGGREGGCRLD
jgi:hypothetical protein